MPDITPDLAAEDHVPLWFPVTAVLAAGFCAATLPDHDPGLNLTLSIGVVGAALLPSVVHDLDPWRWAYAVLLAVVGVFPVVRDAPILLALDVLGVAVLGCLTVTGFHSWVGFVRSGLAVLLRTVDAPRLLLRPIAPAISTSIDSGRFRGAVRGLALGAGLLVIFGGLFASADTAFATVVGDALEPLSRFELLPPRIVVFGIALLLVGGAYAAHRRPLPLPELGEPGHRIGPLEWALPIALLDALFAVFVVIQLTVLFGDNDHVLRTSGLTYAEYARKGFFELLAVAFLTLGVIAWTVRYADLRERKDRLLARGLLGTLCLLTGVVLVSALRRLGLYEYAFGLTWLRIVVHATLFWLAAVFALVVAAGIRGHTDWLARAVVLAGAVTLIALNVANPDALIARRAAEVYARTGRIDVAYLSSLSADAADDLARLESQGVGCLTTQLRAESDEDRSVFAFNLARRHARSLPVQEGC